MGILTRRYQSEKNPYYFDELLTSFLLRNESYFTEKFFK